MDFNNDNYETGFLYAVKELSDGDLSEWVSQRVSTLKTNSDWVAEYLERGEIEKAKNALNRILPGFN